MQDTKAWWQSKAVWGALITLVAVIAQLFGVQIDPELQQQAVNQVTAIAAGIGGLLALYGRIKADKKIGG